MIRIACTNCKTVLSIDDAFAGGVCRCQHCGTIQTVPAHAKNRAATAGAVTGSKAIYHRGGKSDPSSDSLDELSAAVASSGLSGSGLTSNRLQRRGPLSSAGSKQSTTMIFAIVGGVIVVLVIIIIWLATRGGGGGASNGNSAQSQGGTNSVPAPTNNTVAAVSGPNFCGIRLDVPAVVYVLDRGGATKEVFGSLKEAALKSAATLGPDRKFQIVFWHNDSEDAAYPASSTTYASKENIAAATRAIDDVFAFGASDAGPAIQKAVAQSPGAIILATAKGDQLDNSWTDQMLTARGSSNAKIYTIDLSSSGGASQPLKNLAAKTGAQYVQVSSSTLSAFANR